MRPCLALLLIATAAAGDAPSPTPPAAPAAAAASTPRQGADVLAWDCGVFAAAAGKVKATAGGIPLLGTGGTIEANGGRNLLRVQGGQHLTAEMKKGPLAERRPFAIAIEIVPDGTFTGGQAGLIQAGAYQQSGVRILLNDNMHLSVEHFAGTTKEDWTYFDPAQPLQKGRLQTVRYEHDGTSGRLFVDGVLLQEKACPLPAAWAGTLDVGQAGGDRYFYQGLIGSVRIQNLPIGK